MLDFLEAIIQVSHQPLLSQWKQTYKRLAKSSSEVNTPKDNATEAQMLANAEFSQNELGIKAGLSELC
jgi:molybdopterin-biosynthesis enzyme MoeA-like protein